MEALVSYRRPSSVSLGRPLGLTGPQEARVFMEPDLCLGGEEALVQSRLMSSCKDPVASGVRDQGLFLT